MNTIDEARTNKLEQLNLTVCLESLKIDIEWFRAIYHYALPNPNWHSHRSIEIHFMVDGNLIFHLPDGDMEVTAGHALLIPPNCPHCLENIRNDTYFRFILNLSVEPLKNDPEALFIYNALSTDKPVMVAIDSHVCGLLRACMDEAYERISGFLMMIQCNIQMILLYIARELTHARKAIYYISEKKSYDQRRCQHIVRFIEQSASMDPTVGDIARYMHLSTKQVQRIIQGQYGFTVKQLLMQIRLRKAKELLKDPVLSIRDVASMVNFSNEQSFSRFFRNMEGMTPGQYRNSIAPRELFEIANKKG